MKHWSECQIFVEDFLPCIHWNCLIFGLTHYSGESYHIFPFQVSHKSTSCLQRHWSNFHYLNGACPMRIYFFSDLILFFSFCRYRLFFSFWDSRFEQRIIMSMTIGTFQLYKDIIVNISFDFNQTYLFSAVLFIIKIWSFHFCILSTCWQIIDLHSVHQYHDIMSM